MAYSRTATIAELLTQIREDLDEPLDTATNFWDDDYLLARLNRGIREVWQAARETKENWFVRTLRSTDAPLAIYGRIYDPAQLALTASARSLVLPPDFYEARSLIALPSADNAISPIEFVWTDVATMRFREAVQYAGEASTYQYAVDVRWSETGPLLLLAPPVASDASSVPVELLYVFGPHEYTSTESLEQSGLSRPMLDAAVAYAVLEARRREGVGTSITVATASFQDKLSMVTRSSGPRQSQAPEVVEGWLEEWI